MPGHLVDLQAEAMPARQVRGGLADIVKSVAIGLAVMCEFRGGNAESNRRRAFRPALIEFDEAFENVLVILRLVFRRRR